MEDILKRIDKWPTDCGSANIPIGKGLNIDYELVDVTDLKSLAARVRELEAEVAATLEILQMVNTVRVNNLVSIVKFLSGEWGYHYTNTADFEAQLQQEAESGLIRFETPMAAYEALKKAQAALKAEGGRDGKLD